MDDKDLEGREKFWEAAIELDRWMTKNLHCERYQYKPMCALQNMDAPEVVELLRLMDVALHAGRD